MSNSPSSLVADCCLQQYIKGHSELNYCTIRNFCSQTHEHEVRVVLCQGALHWSLTKSTVYSLFAFLNVL